MKLALTYIAIVLTGFIGWVLNLIKVIHLFVSHAPIDTMFIGRIVGVPVSILGAILGWF